MANRPLGVTILAALASVALVLSIVHLLQAIGILPYFIGPISIRDFNLWYVLLWGLMIWVCCGSSGRCSSWTRRPGCSCSS